MPEEISYSRSRFSTRLPVERLYTAGHSWLEEEEESGVWRVGFTKFAVRMLGEIVEMGFETEPGTTIETGQVIGWIEGFKAVTDLFAPLPGSFEEFNPVITDDAELVARAPYTKGWLFRVRGTPGDDCLDVHGYVALLDTTIAKMLGQRHA